MANVVVYGCRKLRVAALDADGGVPVTPTYVDCTVPQQCSFTPQVISGQQAELRGGDELVAQITEFDDIVGMDFTFTDAKLNGQLLYALIGGSWVTASSTYTAPIAGVDSPQFLTKLYVAKFSDGSQHESDSTGYVLFTFPNCTAVMPTFTAQDRSFLTPQFTIKARQNITDSLASWTFTETTVLP